MSSKKFLAASTPNRANLNSSNRVPEWGYDSLLENTTETTVPMVNETYLIPDKSGAVAGSVFLDADSTKSREGSNKTVTPQNEIEIQPEKIKKIRLSFNKPQSRLMNTSSFVAKEPSLPLDEEEQSDGDRSTEDEPVSQVTQNSKEVTKSSLPPSSLSSVQSSSATNNNSNTNEAQSVTIENNSAFYDSSAVPGMKRKRTIKVVLVKSENTPSTSVHKKVKLSNGASSDEIVSDTLTKAAVVTANGDFEDRNDEIAENDNSTHPNGSLNQSSKNNGMANKTQTNGSTTFFLSNQLDSDSETPINRKSMSNSSINPTESFKKKLFSDYFEENSESSENLKKFEKFNRNVWVKVVRTDVENVPKPITIETSSATGEVEMEVEEEAEPKNRTRRGRKPKSLLTKQLEHLNDLDSSKTSKKQYLTDWVEEQNTLLNESFEVVLNRRFKAISRSTQTSDHENESEASSAAASYIVKSKRGNVYRKKTKTLTQESASKRKSERQQSAKKNGTKRVDYKESSTSTEQNVRGRKRREIKTTPSESAYNVADDDRHDHDEHGSHGVSVKQRVTRARGTKANARAAIVETDTNTVTTSTSTQEKISKKAPATRKRGAAKSAKIDEKNSDSDDIPLIEISKKKPANGKTKQAAAVTKKTRANEKSKKTTDAAEPTTVAAAAISKETKKIKTITISESGSNGSEVESVASVVSKTDRKAGTRVLPRRNARNKENALTNAIDEVVETRKTRARTGAATTRATKK